MTKTSIYYTFSKLRLLTLTTILTLYSTVLKAQDYDVISNASFENIKFNNLRTIKQLIDEEDYETLLQQLFGNPISKECYPNPMTGNGCDIYYNGFQLAFDYHTILLELSITGGSNHFLFNGKNLRQGMGLLELKSIFPKSYDSRYTIELEDGLMHLIRVDVAFLNSGSSFLFEFNPNLNTVTKITLVLDGEQ